jgi:hypothetical protein
MKLTITALVVIVVLLFAANNFVRVSDGKSSYGYIEELLFNKPFTKVLDGIFFSKNLNLFNDVNDRAFFVANLISEYGYRIVEENELQTLRTKAVSSLEIALDKCNQIPDDYLAESNKELPIKYRKHFQKALSNWRNGLKNMDNDEVLRGNSEYNSFLIWIQSKNRSDFNKIK